MKIGYVILTHTDPELTAAIANRVTLGTENIAVVHVDAKTDASPFHTLLKNNPQVQFVEKREKIYWGGYNSIVATMKSLKIAAEHHCDRYVLLQGRDFPLHSNAYIADFFEKHKTTEFLKAYNITTSPDKKDYMKCCGYHIYDGVKRDRFRLSTQFVRATYFLNDLGIKYRKGFYRDPDTKKKYEIYWGWAQFALTHNCVTWLLEVYENPPRGFNRYFKHLFPPDETYLHTLIYNSPFLENVWEHQAAMERREGYCMLNLTYFEYPVVVREFHDPSELDASVFENYLYVRKVDMGFVRSFLSGESA